MSTKPIFVATHPRACSTAFERVFMTRRDSLKCLHEPFGDAFYYGPERLSRRFENDEEERTKTGFDNSTYKTIFDRIDREGNEGKRLFIKDMAYYIMPPNVKPASIAPSLEGVRKGVGTSSTTASGDVQPKRTAPYPYDTESEPGNPTVVPAEMLENFHFTILIRDPHYAIPSYWRCTIPPLEKLTGWHEFLPDEAGYDELRRFFEYLRSTGQIGPHFASGDSVNGHATNGTSGKGVEICVIDADDLLDNPSEMIEAYCKSIGMPYDPGMLQWATDEDQRVALDAFEKWPGFHEDVIHSKELKPRSHGRKVMAEPEWDEEWRSKYGQKAAKVIRDTVDQNMEDYLYLKQFALKV